jgi:rod shape determining protein RodA
LSAFKRPLLLAILALAVLGLVAIYSATASEWGTTYVVRQAVWILIGLAAMVGMTHVRTKTLEAFAPIVYGVAVLLLVAVLVVGTGPHGAKRWFNLGFMRFQPSEVAKVAAIMMLARYLSGRKVIGDSIRGVLAVFSILAVPALLVLYEPDMGTALVIAFVGFPMLYAAGLDTLYLAFLISPFIAIVAASEIVAWVIFIGFLVTVMLLARFRTSFVALIFGINFLVGSLAPRIWMSLEPYQRERIEAFLNPEAHSQGAGFQSIQAKIAVGSGGLVGKGLFKGTQKALGLVPEQHTDFVFSVIGEELGFVGSLAVLAILAYVITRLFGMARLARDPFTTYVCFGFASMILVQAVVNVGMNVGMIPVTGITLPFLSYGGSSTLVLLATTGVVLAGYASRKG